MSKKQIAITLDEDLLEKAKDINLSGTLNNLLTDFFVKKEIPKDKTEEDKISEEEKERIYELCREFWQSPQGLETLRKNREMQHESIQEGG